MEDENVELKNEEQNSEEVDVQENSKDENIENEVEENSKTKVKSTRIVGIIFNIVAAISIIILSCAISPKTLQNDTYYSLKISLYYYHF